MSIKLIASDLDGTLLTDKKELSPGTRKALDMAAAQGIYIVPATGRSFESVPEMIREYPGVKYLITANGGAVYSAEAEKLYLSVSAQPGICGCSDCRETKRKNCHGGGY